MCFEMHYPESFMITLDTGQENRTLCGFQNMNKRDMTHAKLRLHVFWLNHILKYPCLNESCRKLSEKFSWKCSIEKVKVGKIRIRSRTKILEFQKDIHCKKNPRWGLRVRDCCFSSLKY